MPTTSGTNPRNNSGHRPTVHRSNKNLLRKGRAKRRIAECLNAIKRIADRISFHGTHPAFKTIFARLSALRNGADSAKTPKDICDQVMGAEAYLAYALQMESWGPENFASFYKELGIDAPKSLGKAVRRKKRIAAPPVSLKAKTSAYSGTEPEEEVGPVIVAPPTKPAADPRAFDPEAGRPEIADVSLDGTQLGASMATAGGEVYNK